MMNRDEIVDAVENFLQAIKEVEKVWNDSYDVVGYANNELVDIAHNLELGKLDGRQLVKRAKEIRSAQLRRRVAKDNKDVLEPLLKYLENNKNMEVNLFKVMKEMNNIRKSLDFREYHPRVRTDLTFGKNYDQCQGQTLVS